MALCENNPFTPTGTKQSARYHTMYLTKAMMRSKPSPASVLPSSSPRRLLTTIMYDMCVAGYRRNREKRMNAQGSGLCSRSMAVATATQLPRLRAELDGADPSKRGLGTVESGSAERDHARSLKSKKKRAPSVRFECAPSCSACRGTTFRLE